MMQTKNPQKITDQNFKELVLDSNIPVLVDFWAEWCAPCQMIVPVVKEIASLFDEKILVGKLNVDENPLTSSTFSIEAIPTLILFDKKNPKQSVLDLMTRDLKKEII